MGHEIVGEIVGIGPDAKGIAVGEKFLPSWLGCGELRRFRPGGYADHMVVPHPRYLIPLDGLCPAEAAPYACSGVTTFGALRKLGAVSKTSRSC